MARVAWNKRLTDEQELEIVEKYLAGGTTPSLAKEYGFKTHNSIRTILIKHNVDAMKKYLQGVEDEKPYKDFSMAQMDSSHKAYFLGLMLTDGYISEERNAIGIDLCDEDAVAYLAESIGCNYRKIVNKDERIQDKFRIDIRSKSLVKELAAFGVVPRKSKTLSAPDLSNHPYLPDVLRGVIDGDGWIRHDGKEFFICSASIDFIHWCIAMLEHLGMAGLKVTEKVDGTKLVRSGRQENMHILKTLVYREPYGMARKYNLLHPEGRSETIIETATTGIV